MSHFSVLVAGPDPAYQLAPYHEFECTGVVDEFVQEIDQTEEKRAEYENPKETVPRYVAPDGSLHDPYEDRFYREPTAEERKHIGPIAGTGSGGGISWSSKDWGDGRGYRTKVHFVPDGWVEEYRPAKDVFTFAKWLTDWNGHDACTYATLDLDGDHKYGHVLLSDTGEVLKIVRRTNPSKRWDWWEIGGRWRNKLLLRDGRKVDSAKKGDIDFDSIRAEAIVKANADWVAAHAILDQHPLWTSWAAMREKHGDENIQAARDEYNAQPAVIAYQEIDKWEGPDEFLLPLNKYTRQAGECSFHCFAFLKDRVWAERGEMGWFGCATNEQSEEDWNRQFAAMLDSIPDDETLTVVDCHI